MCKHGKSHKVYCYNCAIDGLEKQQSHRIPYNFVDFSKEPNAWKQAFCKENQEE